MPGFGLVGPCLDLGVVDRLAVDLAASSHVHFVYETAEAARAAGAGGRADRSAEEWFRHAEREPGGQQEADALHRVTAPVTEHVRRQARGDGEILLKPVDRQPSG
ncbi:hypothetical protein [Cellulomonas wangsupingiae]|uniref:hypothetical protein n=1 Tax=Cellulomonas wangsupingiae TaxID=2968085 RepID=UPI001D0EEF17|nr:hypothetical protein [Cellulomonas wangsupingiae]MCM0638939.1 hypothetical protein [Cellulomonas wangsupingiae]